MSFYYHAIIHCVLIADEVKHREAKAHLLSLNSHTEAYREQAAWCWLLERCPKCNPAIATKLLGRNALTE